MFQSLFARKGTVVCLGVIVILCVALTAVWRVKAQRAENARQAEVAALEERIAALERAVEEEERGPWMVLAMANRLHVQDVLREATGRIAAQEWRPLLKDCPADLLPDVTEAVAEAERTEKMIRCIEGSKKGKPLSRAMIGEALQNLESQAKDPDAAHLYPSQMILALAALDLLKEHLGLDRQAELTAEEIPESELAYVSHFIVTVQLCSVKRLSQCVFARIQRKEGEQGMKPPQRRIPRKLLDPALLEA
jgi:hypothetical protein